MIVSRAWTSAGVAIGLLAGSVGTVNIETVPVGNPGNVPDTRHALPGYGAVNYVYQIGKFEVTAGQYCEFLNAVAKADTYELYDPFMAKTTGELSGCNIQRNGASGNYTYSVPRDWADRPVNYVSWGNAARFANWLHNGQPTGTQNARTTEDGAYSLDAATSDSELLKVKRKTGWRWAIPTEDEWYKAAYYVPNGIAGDYLDYPTCSNAAPRRNLLDANSKNANYFPGGLLKPIDLGKYTTRVGSFRKSPGPYGTFDQGGNVFEWNEAVLFGRYRGMRGGSYLDYVNNLQAGYRSSNYAAAKFCSIGFRVVQAAAPTTQPSLVPTSAPSTQGANDKSPAKRR